MSVAMEMSIQKTGPHERKLLVTVPADTFKAALNRQLQTMAKNIKADGFRAGKMPLNLVEKRVGPQARYEVINQMTEDSIKKTIENEKFILASRPVLDIQKSGEGEPLEFSVTFEIYPDVVLNGVSNIPLNKPNIAISEDDINEAIERLRVRSANWESVDAAAETGMRVRFKLWGNIVGEEEFFENGSEMTMEIGSKEAIPGFEDALMGAQVGNPVEFDLDFPADYFREELAGQNAHFKLEILAVEKPILPELNEEFIRTAARIEAGTMEALREDLKSKLIDSAKRTLNGSLKEKLLDYLLAQHTDLSVPKGLVEQEVAALHQEGHTHDHAEGESACGHTAEAERRVKLSLILGQYIREQEIKLDEQKMYRAALEIAFRSKDPKSELDNIYKNPRMRNMLVSIILEEQAVDHLLDHVQETQETLSYKEMLEKLR